MKKEKPKRPKTGGRQKMPDELKRVRFDTKVEPGTKKKIEDRASAERLSIGRLLDKVFNPKK